MKILCGQIFDLKKNKRLVKEIEKRTGEFSSFRSKPDEKWFSELCYCLLTANSSAATCMRIQREAERKNAFLAFGEKQLSGFLKKSGYRFYNKRAEYIVKAREFLDIKHHLKNKNEGEAREWLVRNVKGLGWKEASHFLRNTGRKDVAIIDRHILRCMNENAKSLNEREYLRIEKRLGKIASAVGMNLAELDLYLWFMQTGRVLK